MSAMVSVQPGRIEHARLARLEKLLSGEPEAQPSDALIEYIFNAYGFRRHPIGRSFDIWQVTNQGALHLYRHSANNHRQSELARLTHTRYVSRKEVKSSSRRSFTYAEKTLSEADSEMSLSSFAVASDRELSGELVAGRVKSLAQMVSEGVLNVDSVRPVLQEMAELMVNQVISNSEQRMNDFVNVVEREITLLKESRQTTESNIPTPNVSRASTCISDSSLHSLVAGFLTDLTDSVAMHLEDLLDEQLNQLTKTIKSTSAVDNTRAVDHEQANH